MQSNSNSTTSTAQSSKLEIYHRMLARIDSRMKFLNKHLEYLKKIQQGKVKESDAIDYLDDVFQAKEKNKNKNKNKNAMLNAAIIGVEEQIQKCINNRGPIENLIKKQKEYDHAVYAVSLQAILKTANDTREYNKKIKTPFVFSADIFDEEGFITQLLDMLKQETPEYLNDFMKVISSAVIVKEEEKSKEEISMQNQTIYTVDWSYHTAILLKLARHIFAEHMGKIIDIRDKIVRNNFSPNSETQENINEAELYAFVSYLQKHPNLITDDDKKDILSILEKILSVNMKMYKALQINPHADSKQVIERKNLDILYGNTKICLDVYSYIKKSERLFIEIEIKEKLKPVLQNVEKLQIALKITEKLFTSMQDKNDFVKSERYVEINARLKEITTMIEEQVKNCRQLTIFENVLPLYKDQELDEIKSQLNEQNKSLSAVVDEFKKEIMEEITNQRLKAEEQVKRELEMVVAAKAKRDEFYKERMEKDKIYKEKVAKIRNEKKLAKANVTKNKSESTEIKTMIDITMMERIRDFSSQHRRTLNKVIEGDADITYQDIKNLIKALGGNIDEKTGSSHRPVVLNKVSYEIVTSADTDDDIELKNASAQVKEGIFFQHKPGHTTRKLCHFNREAFQEIFTEAGITAELLSEIDKAEKSSESANPTTYLGYGKHQDNLS